MAEDWREVLVEVQEQLLLVVTVALIPAVVAAVVFLMVHMLVEMAVQEL